MCLCSSTLSLAPGQEGQGLKDTCVAAMVQLGLVSEIRNFIISRLRSLTAYLYGGMSTEAFVDLSLKNPPYGRQSIS